MLLIDRQTDRQTDTHRRTNKVIAVNPWRGLNMTIMSTCMCYIHLLTIPTPANGKMWNLFVNLLLVTMLNCNKGATYACYFCLTDNTFWNILMFSPSNTQYMRCTKCNSSNQLATYMKIKIITDCLNNCLNFFLLPPINMRNYHDYGNHQKKSWSRWKPLVAVGWIWNNVYLLLLLIECGDFPARGITDMDNLARTPAGWDKVPAHRQ